MTIDKQQPLVVAAYGSGGAGIKQINQAIGAAWEKVLADPDAHKEAADLLGVPFEELAERFPTSPYEAKPSQAGFGPLETALLVFVGNVAYDVAKELAKKAAEGALRTVWERVVQPKVKLLLPSAGLGSEKKLDEKRDADTT